MLKTIRIRYLIPFVDGDSTLHFSSDWRPDPKKDRLVRRLDEFEVRLWPDVSKGSIKTLGLEGLPEFTISISGVTKVFVEVEVQNVSDMLVALIRAVSKSRPRVNSPDNKQKVRPVRDHLIEALRVAEWRFGPRDDLKNKSEDDLKNKSEDELKNKSELDELLAEYTLLGERTLKAALLVYNRFVDFARIQLGQYWLERRIYHEERVMFQLHDEFEAKVQVGKGRWYEWNPKWRKDIIIKFPNPELQLKKSDWNRCGQFVGSDSRPDLILELLSNANYLHSIRSTRSAVIEAASALEIAVSNFGKKAKTDEFADEKATRRFDLKNLHSQIEHLGFSGSLRFLLPVLFSEEMLPSAILKDAQDLVTIRNTVIHGGQRAVDEQKVRKLIDSVRKMCEILTKYVKK